MGGSRGYPLKRSVGGRREAGPLRMADWFYLFLR